MGAATVVLNAKNVSGSLEAKKPESMMCRLYVAQGANSLQRKQYLNNIARSTLASSANGNDFLEKFLNVAPFVARRVQTDNGSEFAKHFDDYCQRNGLTHFFNYPKHPQSNAHLERFKPDHPGAMCKPLPGLS